MMTPHSTLMATVQTVEPNQTDLDNTEWQLAELVDAIAAEVDRAHDTLSLKSYARGLTFAVKTLSLDLEVKLRRDAQGKLRFRTVAEDQTSDTVLKLDFAQVLQNQLTTVRKPLDSGISVLSASNGALEDLPDIAAEQIVALNNVGVYAQDDLARYAQTPQILTELSRQTRIAEAQLRQWLGLPFIRSVSPTSGAPGSVVTIEGGNFGDRLSSHGTVQFQQQSASILGWQDSRLTVAMPQSVTGNGLLVVQTDNQFANPVMWDALTASPDRMRTLNPIALLRRSH